MNDNDDDYVTAEEAAIHEAGHVAVMRASGISVSVASIEEGEHQWHGNTVWGAEHLPDLETPATRYAIHCAGLVAIVLHRGSLVRRDLSGAGVGVEPHLRGGDAEKARDEECADPEQAWRHAVTTLRNNWGFVRRLATYLAKIKLSIEEKQQGDQLHTADKGKLDELWQEGPNAADELEIARQGFESADAKGKSPT